MYNANESFPNHFLFVNKGLSISFKSQCVNTVKQLQINKTVPFYSIKPELLDIKYPNMSFNA